ncbi:hypothetical protein SLG_15290 [Sphingobium sp. SYK-6]|uniref:DUF6282 family protein n=1 Tax=Sphingobium sp. (strain NBRC 103272 / SYK-6) TaxID=627192 RepID=UPI00022776DF|nr:DUF6282 family protein [Sphingobium sp. SYK-6]BAK66204.1 hypothetical protein SLG_15290 [Sphingobium sp. SYK-6]
MATANSDQAQVAPQSTLDERVDALLVGAIDMHCHSGPSVMPRMIDHIEALQEASDARMRALLFKDHFYSATPITALLSSHYAHLDVTMLSGVPLNDTSGGLNPYAVDHGLKLGAKLVWMPTFSAANHIRQNRHGELLPTSVRMRRPKMLTVVDEDGRLKDEVKEILDQIAEFDAVLSAGHLHISEIWPLFEEAQKRGVKRRLVQHPTYTIGATYDDIAELTRTGAFIEHSLCMFIPGSRFQYYPHEELRDVINAGGTEQTILGSDLGQVNNPTPVTGFRSVIRLCIDLGFDDDAIRRLVGGNAARLIGLPDEKASAAPE